MPSVPIDPDGSLHVDAFTRPGDADSAPGIRAALAQALALGVGTLRFAPGRYLLRSAVDHPAAGAVHDAANLGQAPVQACHLHLRGAQGLHLEGALDAQGDPATVLVGFNDGANHGTLPAVLWCEDCTGLEVSGLAFTREPAYASAGVVCERSATGLAVEVFAGEPCWDGMGTYCMNRCDPASGALRGGSLTFGQGAGQDWRLRGGRILTLADPAVAARVAVGELLSWHQGARSVIQTYFGACHGLRLARLRTCNAIGLAMVAEGCRDIEADRIVLRPDGRRLFTAPRDGWKLFKCSGRIALSRLDVHGVRMDGQNLHSTWLVREGGDGGREAIFQLRYALTPLAVGSVVECWLGDVCTLATIASWRQIGRTAEGHRLHLRFDVPLPAGPGLLAAPRCWQPDRYTCRDSLFSSIAGAGHLIRGGRVEITGCSYRQMMCPGVFLGAENGGHPEGGHVLDALVEGCSFEDCGGFERERYDRGPGGCIATGTIGPFLPATGRFNRGIRLLGNRFAGSPVGIRLRQAQEVRLAGNHFTDVAQPLLVDGGSTADVTDS